MNIVKNSHEQLILQPSRGSKVSVFFPYGLISLFFISWGLYNLVTGESVARGIGSLLGALFFGFITYWLFFFTEEINFDHNLGKMIIKTGAKPFFRGNNRILRTEISRVELKYTPANGSGFDHEPEKWELMLTLPYKKKVLRWEEGENTTEILASRIEAFWHNQPILISPLWLESDTENEAMEDFWGNFTNSDTTD